MLGVISDTDIYVNLDTHLKAVELQNIKIFQYIGAINFASSNSFKRSLYRMIGDNLLRKIDDRGLLNDEMKKLQTHALIIDLSNVTHLDIAGCKTLAEIQTDLHVSNAILYLTCPNDRVLESVKRAEFLSVGEFIILPSIHDAVIYFKGTISESA